MRQPLLILLSLVSLIAVGSNAVAQSSTAVSGRVLGYLFNRMGDYDGLRLNTITGEMSLHFPPHTAATVRQLAVIGKSIQADVEPEHPGPGQPNPGLSNATNQHAILYRLIRVRDQTTGAAVQIADLTPPPPQAGKLVQAEGPLVGTMKDEAGQLIGLLTNKYLIALKPHQREQISSLLVGVKRIGVVGYERTANGFINRSGRPLIRPTSLTIRGQTFTL